MAKPIAANDLPPPWGGAGNYGATVYSQFLAWGAPNPLFPGATPWSGQPRLDAAGIVSFANNGFEPQLPTPASPYNEYMRRLQVYTQWVEDGTFAADATAHVVETDGAGKISAAVLGVTGGATFDGDVTLGDAVGDSIQVPGSANFQQKTTFNDDIDVLGGGAVLGFAGTSITFPLVDASSGELRTDLQTWTVDTTPSGVDGHEQWDGFRMSIGNGASIQPAYHPFLAYTDERVGSAALEDIPGLSVTLEIPPNREVTIELYCNQKVATAGEVAKLEIRAENAGAVDTVSILKSGSGDQALSPLPAAVSNGDRRPNSVLIVWRPDDDIPAPVNDTWTIQAEHGITNADTLTSANCVLRVTYR